MIWVLMHLCSHLVEGTSPLRFLAKVLIVRNTDNTGINRTAYVWYLCSNVGTRAIEPRKGDSRRGSVGAGFPRPMFRDLPPCNDMGADASAMFSSGRGDLAPTIFGEGIDRKKHR